MILARLPVALSLAADSVQPWPPLHDQTGQKHQQRPIGVAVGAQRLGNAAIGAIAAGAHCGPPPQRGQPDPPIGRHPKAGSRGQIRVEPEAIATALGTEFKKSRVNTHSLTASYPIRDHQTRIDRPEWIDPDRSGDRLANFGETVGSSWEQCVGLARELVGCGVPVAPTTLRLFL